jgi:hypothetical protein
MVKNEGCKKPAAKLRNKTKNTFQKSKKIGVIGYPLPHTKRVLPTSREAALFFRKNNTRKTATAGCYCQLKDFKVPESRCSETTPNRRGLAT